MSQTKLGSLIEALVNILIGWVIAFVSQLVLFPRVGIHIPISTNFELSLYFTAISIARSYITRRYFNARLHAAAQRLAGATTER